MAININKTKAVIFNISGKIFRSEFKLGNQLIHVTESDIYSQGAYVIPWEFYGESKPPT